MTVVVISPEAQDAREHEVLAALCARGLERYHVRKPGWTAAQLRGWLERVPAELRGHLVLHEHHALAAEYGVGGVHEKDQTGERSPRATKDTGNGRGEGVAGGLRSPVIRSRSCHTAAAVRAALGAYDAVFFSPVFPSLSKPGYAPDARELGEVEALLSELWERVYPAMPYDANRGVNPLPQLRTKVIALGGITAHNAVTALQLGFDGVAVLGAIWQSADPVRVFSELQSACAAGCGRPVRIPTC